MKAIDIYFYSDVENSSGITQYRTKLKFTRSIVLLQNLRIL